MQLEIIKVALDIIQLEIIESEIIQFASTTDSVLTSTRKTSNRHIRGLELLNFSLIHTNKRDKTFPYREMSPRLSNVYVSHAV